MDEVCSWNSWLSPILYSLSLQFWDDKTSIVTISFIKPLEKNPIVRNLHLCFADDTYFIFSCRGENVWSNSANISSDLDVRYRYFVCIPLEKEFDGQQKLVVRRWETGMNPRIIAAQGKKSDDYITNIKKKCSDVKKHLFSPRKRNSGIQRNCII
jgi:hypothetical protein